MIDVDSALTFIGFINERHRIWEQRQKGLPQPWTSNPVLAGTKFTNVFRVLDPGSQFVFNMVSPELPGDTVLLRLMLYRYTNLPSAWIAFLRKTWRYPTYDTLDSLKDFWAGYDGRIFSPAYVVRPPGDARTKIGSKAVAVIDWIQHLFSDPKFYKGFELAGSLRHQWEYLRQQKYIGDFMAMQIVTDWGYTEHCGVDRENAFVALGPGSTRGALAIDASNDPMETLRWAYDAVWFSDEQPRLQVRPNRTRQLSLMDIQNCLCEYSKYVRRSVEKPKPPYVPAHPGKQEAPVLPKHW